MSTISMDLAVVAWWQSAGLITDLTATVGSNLRLGMIYQIMIPRADILVCSAEHDLNNKLKCMPLEQFGHSHNERIKVWHTDESGFQESDIRIPAEVGAEHNSVLLPLGLSNMILKKLTPEVFA